MSKGEKQLVFIGDFGLFDDAGINSIIWGELMERGIDLSLPVEWKEYGSNGWGGPPVDDPLTLYVSIDGLSYDEPPVFKLNFRDACMGMILGWTDPLTGVVDGEGSKSCKELSSALRLLADQIDARIGSCQHMWE